MKPDYSFDKNKQRVIGGGTVEENDAEMTAEPDIYQPNEEDEFMLGTEY